MNNNERYGEIVNSFDTPNNGSEEIWGDFSAYGFYVFDWQWYEVGEIKIT